MTKPSKPTGVKLELVYIPLSEIKEWPGNPKLHDLEAIIASIEEHAFRDAPELDPTTSQLVAGHGRKQALEVMKGRYQKESKPPPPGILEKDGEWLIPVTKGPPFSSTSSAESYLLANNKTQTLGGVDKKLLTKMLDRVKESTKGLKGSGFSSEELESLHNKSKANLDNVLGLREEAPHSITEEEADELISESDGHDEDQDSPQDRTVPTVGGGLSRPLVFYFPPDIYEKVYARLGEIQKKEKLPNLADTLEWVLNKIS